jgi:hypothetical protein
LCQEKSGNPEYKKLVMYIQLAIKILQAHNQQSIHHCV